MSGGGAFDAVVIGAGPAGAATAIILARAGWRTAIVERQERPRFKIGETVPPSIGEALRGLGVPTGFAELGHSESLGTASAWGSAQLIYRDYMFDGTGNGWHLNRVAFDQAVADLAVATGAAMLRSRFVEAQRHDGQWQITGECADGRRHSLRAPIVVDASGRRALFATAHGARRRVVDRLIGVAALLEAPNGVPGHTVIESAACGWWYAAAQPCGQVVVAFLSDPDIIWAHGWTESRSWTSALLRTHHVSRWAEGATDQAQLSIWPAGSHLLHPSAADNWIAVGDAAVATDPLSSAGILNAISTAKLAAQTLLQPSGSKGASGTFDYQQALHRQFETFLDHRRHFYAIETRFDTPFWQRRHRSETEATSP